MMQGENGTGQLRIGVRQDQPGLRARPSAIGSPGKQGSATALNVEDGRTPDD